MTADVAMRIVALGDSTTAGTPGFRSPLEAPPDGDGDERSQYAYWLMRAHPDWRVQNRGVNGERTDEIAARFDRDVRAEPPDVVVIVAGVNDIYQGAPAPRVIASLGALYDRAIAAGLGVVAGTVLPFDTASDDQNARIGIVNRWILNDAARTRRLAVADTHAAVAAAGDPHRLAGSPDGLHPDIDGYRRMAAALRSVIETAAQTPFR